MGQQCPQRSIPQARSLIGRGRACPATQEALPTFFQRVLALKGEHGERMRMHERVAYIVFSINAFQVGPCFLPALRSCPYCSGVSASCARLTVFCLGHSLTALCPPPSWRGPTPPPLQSLEDEAVRAQMLRLVSLPLWHALSRGRLQLELHDQPQVRGEGLTVPLVRHQYCMRTCTAEEFASGAIKFSCTTDLAGNLSCPVSLGCFILIARGCSAHRPRSWPSIGSTWPSVRPRRPRRRGMCPCSSAPRPPSCLVRGRLLQPRASR